jgi:hypothetical protein
VADFHAARVTKDAIIGLYLFIRFANMAKKRPLCNLIVSPVLRFVLTPARTQAKSFLHRRKKAA